MTTLLLCVPVGWGSLWTGPLSQIAPDLKLVVQGRDEFDPAAIDYALSFRPPPGFLKTLTNVKAVFSVGAGVDGFLADPDYPRQVPLVRFVDRALSREMAQYVVMHTLIFHRQQRLFDEFQSKSKWQQRMPPRATTDTRIGIFGLGEIGTMAAERLRDLDFKVAGWSRSKKSVPGVESFAGQDAMKAFLARSDILICLLPLTPQTRGILNKQTFEALPDGAFVINVARGGHLIEDDLVAAIDSGHLAGATLDVFQTEPLPETSPLWMHPKITVTPHVAAISDPRAMARSVADGIARAAKGLPLENTIDFARGY
ncbi:MAG: glyoxylate/hydroxypyruvate reductase A [Rhizomicrobium sp.]